MPDRTAPTPEEINAVLERRYATLREARLRFAGDTGTDAASAAERFVVARSGDRRFAFPLAAVTEVLPLTARHTRTLVPGAPPAFWGLLLVRGEVRPVFDLKPLLGIPTSDSDENEHIVFVQDGTIKESVAGIKTDRVEQIAAIPEPTPAEGTASAALPARFVRWLHQDDAAAVPVQVVDLSALLASLRGDAQAESAPEPGDESQSADDIAPASVEEE